MTPDIPSRRRALQFPEIRTRWHVFLGSVMVCCLAVAGSLAMMHLQFASQPEILETIRWKGLSATVAIAYPISVLVLDQLYRNDRLKRELIRLVNRDRLTDADTRDYFFARMEAAPDAFGVCLMVDIDHFKRVNDTHGHLVGDKVIAEVARLLRAQVRGEDIVCRFGGEEFVIFLQERSRDEGLAAAERMREVVEGARLTVGEIELAVTISIGGAPKQRVQDIAQAIQEADAALYRAKQTGRNRTVFGPPRGSHLAELESALAAG